MPATKATKKFQKNKLKGVLDQRKAVAKIKQRQNLKEKKKARRERDASSKSDATKPAAENSKTTAGVKDLKDMTVDEFFQGGLEIPEDPGQSKKPKTKGTNGSMPVMNGKRKRDLQEDEPKTAKESKLTKADFDSDSESADSLKGHKEDLEALAEKDPKFYRFLQENDAELLDFSDDQGPDELVAAEEAVSTKAKAISSERGKEATEVSIAMVEKWEKALREHHSLRAMRELLLAFRSAAHAGDLDEKGYKYSISSAEAYHKVLVVTLEGLPDVLEYHLPVKEHANGRVRVPTDSKTYSTLSPLLNSHAASLAHLLEGLSDSATINLTLKSTNPLLPYFLSFKKSIKALAKIVLAIWSDAANTEATRISAFLLIRRLAVTGDPSLREAVLKATYQALVKGVRATTMHTLPGINLMKNSAAELWSLDPKLGYTTGFAYIRQLAILLRPAIARPTADAHRAIYNWQFVHSLDFWSRVLAQHCSGPTVPRPAASPLHPLVYPVVQLCLGAARLVPSPTFFPLRFQLTRALLRLGHAARTYIPMAPLLLEVLRSPELSKPGKASTLKPLDFRVALRAPKAYLRTRVYQDGCGEQAVELLAEFFGTWAKSVAFPELVLAPSVMLRRWLKEVSSGTSKGQQAGARGRNGKDGGKKTGADGNKNGRMNGLVSLLVQKLAAHAAYVEAARCKVEFAPSNRREVENFMRDVVWEDTPLGAYMHGMRTRREEKEKDIEKGRRDQERKKEFLESEDRKRGLLLENGGKDERSLAVGCGKKKSRQEPSDDESNFSGDEGAKDSEVDSGDDDDEMGVVMDDEDEDNLIDEDDDGDEDSAQGTNGLRGGGSAHQEEDGGEDADEEEKSRRPTRETLSPLRPPTRAAIRRTIPEEGVTIRVLFRDFDVRVEPGEWLETFLTNLDCVSYFDDDTNLLKPKLPTLAEVRGAIPYWGISVRDLLDDLGVPWMPRERRLEFFPVIKAACRYERGTKILKPSLPTVVQIRAAIPVGGIRGRDLRRVLGVGILRKDQRQIVFERIRLAGIMDKKAGFIHPRPA